MILNVHKFYTKFQLNFPGIFRNFLQNLPEIFTTFCNSYELHSQNFYILRKNFINNNYIYIKFIQQFRQIKIAGTFIHMNVGKYRLAPLIRIASSPFGVFQEND